MSEGGPLSRSTMNSLTVHAFICDLAIYTYSLIYLYIFFISSGSTCSGGSLADLTAALPPITTGSSASRSSSLQKLQSRASYSGAGQGDQAVSGCASTASKGNVCPDAQSLRSVASTASVATTGTAHSILDPLQSGISAASSELNGIPCFDLFLHSEFEEVVKVKILPEYAIFTARFDYRNNTQALNCYCD